MAGLQLKRHPKVIETLPGAQTRFGATPAAAGGHWHCRLAVSQGLACAARGRHALATLFGSCWPAAAKTNLLYHEALTINDTNVHRPTLG